MRNQKEVVIELNAEVCLYLEKLSYEVDGLKILHTHALQSGVEKEKIREIREDFDSKFKEYQMAKQEMWSQYKLDYPNSRWYVDFLDSTLHIINE